MSDDKKAVEEVVLRIVSLEEFLGLKLPPIENLLDPWLGVQGLALIYAPRGIGKTHVALGIAHAVASGGSFLGWSAPKPQGVLYLDGEMPANMMQERLKAIVAANNKAVSAPFKILTPDLQSGMCVPDISTIKGQQALEPYLSDIKLIIVDNITTLCRSGNENETESWRPVQEWALRMRASGRAVLFIHHAGKKGAQRGASAKEDTLSVVISLIRPQNYSPAEGAVFEVHFEKARGLMGDAINPFKAKLGKDENNKQCWITSNVTPDNQTLVKKLFNEGYKQKEIAVELDIDKSTVSRYVRRAKQEGITET